jgi:hypothetical protein
LADYISQVPFLDLKGSFKDAILAYGLFAYKCSATYFLDIHLPRLKGIGFFENRYRIPLR